MRDRVGEQLGNYRLVRFLGEGGFAEVYLGEHIYLRTSAAIKVLHLRVAQEEVEPFLIEARTVANLIHPHIVRVLEFGLEGSNPFLVMDYAPNGTLRQKHERGTRLSPREILPYLRQVADALQYAHDEKLIHRDVKPENMLINKRNEILLSDFGIALETKSSRYQNTQDVVGTAAYMAPEQIQGKPRRSSDQYALGIVVYEWLTGERPFHGTVTEIAMQHLLVPPPPLREKGVTLSSDIEQVLMTALAKDPQQRFGSVSAFARAFEQACQGPTAFVPPPSRPPEELPPTPYITFTPPAEEPLPPTPVATPHAVDIPIEKPLPPTSVAAPPVLDTPIEKPLPPTPVAAPPVLDTPIEKPLLIYRGHSFWVNAVAWSPDGPSSSPGRGSRIASAGTDRTVQVWESTTGHQLLFYYLHKADVTTVAWSPDGTRIASAGRDRTVQVWEVIANGKVVIYRNHKGLIRSVAWSPDGTRIVSGGVDSQVHIWDAASGQKLLFFPLHKADVYTVAWSPDGTRIASGDDDRTVQVWEAIPNGKVVTYSKHMNRVNCVAWSPNGTSIASASKDRTVRIWDATTGSDLLLFNRHTEEVSTVAWSPDGTRIASAGKDRTVLLWEAVPNSKVIRYRRFSNTVTSVTWSPDGTQIAAGCADGTVQIWQCPQ